MKKHLGMSKIFTLALGQLGVMFMLMTLGMYTLRFFSPTENVALPLLLPIGVIGVIQGFALLFDALIDPWIATVGDNSKNPKGRRIPFMRKACIPAGIFCVLVFFVPVHSQSWVNVVWVVAMLLLYAICRSFFDINLQALIPEIIPDTFRRARFHTVAAIMSNIGNFLGSTVPVFVAILVVSMGELLAWQISLAVFPIIGTVLMIICAFSINETEYVEPAVGDEERIGLWKSLRNTLKNKVFLVFMFGAVAFGFAIGIFNAALLFVIDLLLGLEATMLTVSMLIVTVLAFILYIPILKVIKKTGKRKLMLLSIIICGVIFLLLFFHAPISNFLGSGTVAAGGLWAGMAGAGAKVGNVVLILIVGVLFAYPQAAGGAVGSSMFADIAQYDNLTSGENRMGMFMAVQSIIGILPSTLVPMIVGVSIYIGSKNSMPTEQGVRITMIIAFVFTIATFLLYYLYKEKKVFEVIIPAAEAAAAAEEGAIKETEAEAE